MPNALPQCLRCGSDMQQGYVADRAAGGYNPPKWFAGNLATGFLGGIAKAASKPLLVRTYRCVRCGYLESYADNRAEKEVRRQAEADPRTVHRRLWFRFLTGLAYTALIANVFSVCTNCTYPFAFVAVLGSFFLYGGLGLWWLTLWARQRDARPGQFGVGSLLLLMVFAAMFLGTVRWIVVQVSQQWPQSDGIGVFCIFAVICLLLACISIPFILWMSEAMLWAAVWFVRRPQVRRLLRGRRKNDGSSIGPEMPRGNP